MTIIRRDSKTDENYSPADLSCSVGVMAHNEERNIALLLERLCAQKLILVSIKEIIVVASGCTDSTEEIVSEYAEKDKRIKLVTEKERRGKAEAVNLFLAQASEEYILLVGADTLPDINSVERLVRRISDPMNGMAGARPIPLNTTDDFAGYVVNFLWELHHELALRMPKCGEMVAFRKVFERLPPDTIVDEPQIEALVRSAGYRVVYEPSAIVYNMGPSSLKEGIMRRRSIISGYIRLSWKTDYRVSTQRLRWWLLLLVLKRIATGKEPFFYCIGAMLFEVYCRILGRWDAAFSRQPLHIWQPAESTKCFDSGDVSELTTHRQ